MLLEEGSGLAELRHESERVPKKLLQENKEVYKHVTCDGEGPEPPSGLGDNETNFHVRNLGSPLRSSVTMHVPPREL